jgi:hypothetical protein
MAIKINQEQCEIKLETNGFSTLSGKNIPLTSNIENG